MSSDENRRSAIRFSSATSVNYTKGEREDDDELTAEQFDEVLSGAETLDLSVGGCQILTKDKLPLKTEFTFDLKLDDAVVTVRGKTVRARRTPEGRYKIGIQFLEVEPMAQDLLQLYLVESGADELE